MASTEKLITSYVGQKQSLEDLQAQIKETQVEMRETLRKIVDGEGKGPFKFGDRNCRIVDRKGLLCLMPSDRPKTTRKPKAEKKAPAKKRAKKAAEDAVAAE